MRRTLPLSGRFAVKRPQHISFIPVNHTGFWCDSFTCRTEVQAPQKTDRAAYHAADHDVSKHTSLLFRMFFRSKSAQDRQPHTLRQFASEM